MGYGRLLPQGPVCFRAPVPQPPSPPGFGAGRAQMVLRCVWYVAYEYVAYEFNPPTLLRAGTQVPALFCLRDAGVQYTRLSGGSFRSSTRSTFCHDERNRNADDCQVMPATCGVSSNRDAASPDTFSSGLSAGGGSVE